MSKKKKKKTFPGDVELLEMIDMMAELHNWPNEKYRENIKKLVAEFSIQASGVENMVGFSIEKPALERFSILIQEALNSNSKSFYLTVKLTPHDKEKKDEALREAKQIKILKEKKS